GRGELRVHVRVPVRHDDVAERAGGGGDAAPLGHAADDAGVRLQDLRRTTMQQVAERPARRLDLAGGDRDRAACDETGVTADVVGSERLLEPPWIERGERARRAKRLVA